MESKDDIPKESLAKPEDQFLYEVILVKSLQKLMDTFIEELLRNSSEKFCRNNYKNF